MKPIVLLSAKKACPQSGVTRPARLFLPGGPFARWLVGIKTGAPE